MEAEQASASGLSEWKKRPNQRQATLKQKQKLGRMEREVTSTFQHINNVARNFSWS